MLGKKPGWTKLGESPSGSSDIDMYRLNQPLEESALCPFCKAPLHPVYVKIGGGVWFHESAEFMKTATEAINFESPVHCLIGSSGYQLDPENWPKTGYFCSTCNAVCIRK